MRRVAILIANSAFSPNSGLTPLRFPPDDVAALERLLLDERTGRYDKVVTLVNKTHTEILREYNALLRGERGAEFLFYYSGHGKPSDLRKLFLAANDTTEDDLLVTGVPFSTIIDLKENYGVRTFTAILDCCFAGLGSSVVRGSEDDELRAMGSGRGIFFLGAANATEVAKEDEALGHGVLTSAVLEGLSTGLADKDNDGQVSGNDLFSWCADYARRHGAQKVVMTGQAESQEVIVAYSRRKIVPDMIERLRANIATAYTQEWLPQQELDELRDYYLVPAVVVLPPSGSLADRLLAYTEKRITLREFLGRAGDPAPPPTAPRPPPSLPPQLDPTKNGRESRTPVSPSLPRFNIRELTGSSRRAIYFRGLLAALIPVIGWSLFFLYNEYEDYWRTSAVERWRLASILSFYALTCTVYAATAAETWFRFHNKPFVIVLWLSFITLNYVTTYMLNARLFDIASLEGFTLITTGLSALCCVLGLFIFGEKTRRDLLRH